VKSELETILVSLNSNMEGATVFLGRWGFFCVRIENASKLVGHRGAGKDSIFGVFGQQKASIRVRKPAMMEQSQKRITFCAAYG
jgi:hypothetical protein